MTRAQERRGRQLLRALRGLEFTAKLTDGRPLEVEVVEHGLGRTPRVEVRHPQLRRDGTSWLVGLIALEPEVALVFAQPGYRATLEQVLRRLR